MSAVTVIKNQSSQGDVMFRRVSEIPPGLTPLKPGAAGHIVAHSETGHHHTVRAAEAANGSLGMCSFFAAGEMLGYLDIGGGGGLVEHHRPTDTHAPMLLTPGKWEVRRQREHTPEGWRRVDD